MASTAGAPSPSPVQDDGALTHKQIVTILIGLMMGMFLAALDQTIVASAMRVIADDLSQRLIGIFLRGPDGRRPVFGSNETMQTDPHWRDLLPFHEYFHGDTAAGLGAAHQTGWTALVANLLVHKRLT